MKHILGVRPEYEGLGIDLCIPAGWDVFRVTRVLRGARYLIIVRNPSHVCRGIRTITVDSKPIQGAVVPAFGDRADHLVDVVLG